MNLRNARTLAATIALTGMLALSACGGNDPISGDDVKKVDTQIPQADIDEETGEIDWCTGITPESVEADEVLLSAFSKEEIASAICFVITFNGETGMSNITVPGQATDPGQVAQLVMGSLTPELGNEVYDLAEKAIGGDGEALDNLNGITGFSIDYDGYPFAYEADPLYPITSNREWSASTVSTFEPPAGDPYAGITGLAITQDFTDTLLLTDDGDTSKQVESVYKRTASFSVYPTGDPEKPWMIGGWNFTDVSFSEPTPIDTPFAIE